jgi:hypothetical protein
LLLILKPRKVDRLPSWDRTLKDGK